MNSFLLNGPYGLMATGDLQVVSVAVASFRVLVMLDMMVQSNDSEMGPLLAFLH